MTAIFRCDATAEIGFGHLSRCIALAEAFRLSAIESIFAGVFDSAAKNQIASAGFRSLELSELVNGSRAEFAALRRILNDNPQSFIIIDSYRADEIYLASLRSLARATVVIDDFKPLAAYPCDAILNFTWEAPALEYPEGPELFLGPHYFPARRRLVDLRQASIARDRSGPVRNLLIAIAGFDPKGIARRLVPALARNHRDICLRVIAANDHDLDSRLGDFGRDSQIVPRQPDLSEQLLWADACITGGGLIKYESAFMGVPAAAISQNEGQASETLALVRAGLVFDLGLADDRGDRELGDELDRFLGDHASRARQAERVRDAFPPDPSANAASAIAKAVGR